MKEENNVLGNKKIALISTFGIGILLLSYIIFIDKLFLIFICIPALLVFYVYLINNIGEVTLN